MFKKVIYFILVFILGGIIGALVTLLVQKINGPKQTVNITGLGVIEAPADAAMIGFTIQNTSWSQDQAEKDNKKEVQTIKEKLTGLGIPESRITQSTYNIGPLPMLPVQGSPPTIINRDLPESMPFPISTKNLTATTNLAISVDTIKNIDSIFTVINESTNAKITSTDYTLKNTSPYEAKAREKALQDARSQVESIAKINKLQVGKLLSLTNTGTSGPVYKQAMMGSSGQSNLNTSVSYGEKTINISATFNVTYELY